MIKLLTVIAVGSAIALSIAPAQARRVNHHHRAVEGAYAYAPSLPGSGGHFINDGVGYNGTGTFSDGRRVPGTNWNPNQN
jgi:hypothetical protein